MLTIIFMPRAMPQVILNLFIVKFMKDEPKYRKRRAEISAIIIHQSILYELLSNLIGSLLLYSDFILHRFTFYGAFKLLILHGFTFFGGFDRFVSSSWPTAVLQVDASQLTLLAVCCI